MNYQKIYNQLITKRQNEILPKNIYGEIHHIVPKCLGGTNENSNLVRLTAREHYIAHLLLAKIYDNVKIYAAVKYMQINNEHHKRNFKFNSRLFQKMREEFNKKISEHNKGENNGMYGKSHSEETRKKLSLSHIGKNFHPNWKPNIEQREKISKKAKERLSDKNKHPRFGKHCSDETKKKISEKNKGRIPWNKNKKKSQEQ